MKRQKHYLKCYEENSEAFDIVIERHSDGFVSYPLGLKGVVVGQGDTYKEALADVRSAINFHIETFGAQGFHRSAYRP